MPTTATTRYDRYGRAAGYISPIEGAPEAYLIDQSNSAVTYVCYYETGSGPRAIRRIEKDTATGVTRISVGWGAWDDRATIDYYPVNSVFTVNDETHALESVSPNNTPVPAFDAA